MAVEFHQSQKWLRKPQVYYPEDSVEDFDDADYEFEKLEKVINETFDSFFRTCRSVQNVTDAAFEGSTGKIKRQLSHQQIKKDGVRSEVVDKGRRSFITTTNFGTQTLAFPLTVGRQLYWTHYPNTGILATSFQAWGSQYLGTLDVNPTRIISGTTTIYDADTVYCYIDPRNDMSPYTVQMFRASVSLPVNAIRDGRILLCQARSTFVGGVRTNIQPRNSMYGGGMWIGALG